MRTNCRDIAITMMAIAIGCLGLAGCGGSSSAAASSSSVASTPSSDATTASSSPAAANTPLTAAQEFTAAIQTHDGSRACAVVVPSERAMCTSQYVPLMSEMTFTHAAFHQTVVSGSRALISITGHFCVAGHCQDISDPSSGMPSATLTFDQAWALTKTTSTAMTAASPCQRINGQWYVVIGSL